MFLLASKALIFACSVTSFHGMMHIFYLDGCWEYNLRHWTIFRCQHALFLLLKENYGLIMAKKARRIQWLTVKMKAMCIIRGYFSVQEKQFSINFSSKWLESNTTWPFKGASLVSFPIWFLGNVFSHYWHNAYVDGIHYTYCLEEAYHLSFSEK